MTWFDVTIWPQRPGEKPWTSRRRAPTSIDALNRALGEVREEGVAVAVVRKVSEREAAVDEMRKGGRG